MFMYLLLEKGKETIPVGRKKINLPVQQGRGVWYWVPEAQ